MTLTSIICVTALLAPTTEPLTMMMAGPFGPTTTTMMAAQSTPRKQATPAPRTAPAKAPAGRNGSTTVTVAPATRSTQQPLAPYREIWASCWRPVPAGCTLLTQQIRVEGSFFPGFPAVSLATRPNPAKVAQMTRALPEGRAALMWWRYSNSLFQPEPPNGDPSANSINDPRPWDANAVQAVSQEWTAWLQEFRAAGGRLDYLIGDCERWGMYFSWSLSDAQIQKIAADPRASQPYYSAPSLNSLLSATNTNISMVKQFYQTKDYMKWDCAMGTLTAAAMRKAVWDPAVALFPKVRGSNYEGVKMPQSPAPDLNGHPHPWDNVVGSASSPVAYGRMESVSTGWFIDSADSTQLSKSGTKRLDRTPWNAFLLDIQTGRACKRNAPELPLQPWIALQKWRGRIAGLVPYPDDPRYHDEMVRHYALLGTEVFIYWNPEAVTLPEGNWTEADRTACAFRLNGVLAEINSKTDGVLVATATTKAVGFDARVVTTGAQRRDGKWIWRTAAHPEVKRLRNSATGATVGFDASGVGRWDVTDTNTPPTYVPDTSQRSSMVLVEPR